jgi:hypothetical protein
MVLNLGVLITFVDWKECYWFKLEDRLDRKKKETERAVRSLEQLTKKKVTMV